MAEKNSCPRTFGRTAPLSLYGCLGDLGWDRIRLSLWTMKEQLPQTVSGRILSEAGRNNSPSPVPAQFSGELHFANGLSSGFYCSFQTHTEEWAVISGDKASLRISDFVLPCFGSEISFEIDRTNLNIAGVILTNRGSSGWMCRNMAAATQPRRIQTYFVISPNRCAPAV